MVITGVADRAAARLAHLVYFDAVVPQDGQSSLDIHTPEEVARLEERVRLGGDGWRNPGSSWRKPQPPPDWDAPMGSHEWERARLVPHPFKAVTEPVRLRNPAALALPRTFIYCTRGRPNEDIHGRRSASIERARTDPLWRHRELATGHIAMLEAPEQVARLLLEVV
jgi:hypothetical protein